MRTASFDRARVLGAAMHTFRHKGFAANTMQDLVTATGLHPGSIYGAFGNKKGLLLATVDQYVVDRQAELEQCFVDATPFEGIHRYMARVQEEMQSCDSMACLLVKMLQEIGEQDKEISSRVSTLLAQHERRLAEALLAAQQTGEVRRDATSEQLARWLMVGIYGMRTYAHVHTGVDCMQEVADRLLATLQPSA
mgnify:CR=1 FL=1